MGIMARLLGREKRDNAGVTVADLAGWWSGPGLDRGPTSAILAENLSAVAGCVNLISGAIASLPVTVYRRIGDARIEQPDHPVSRMIANGPNDHQTWCEWLEQTCADYLKYGNSLSIIQNDKRGVVTALIPIPWPAIRPGLLEANSTRLTPKIVFSIVASWGWFVSTPGVMQRYLSSEVLHIKDRSDDGFIGRSKISRSSEVIQGALGVQRHQLSQWENGTSLSGVLTHPKSLSDPARKRLAADFEEYRGVHNAKKAMLLEEGLDWKSISVSPEDAEVLASRRFSVIEIARLFSVPPILLSDWQETRLSNASVADSFFARYALLPLVRKIEATFAKSIFTDPALSLDIDLGGLQRGDYVQRWQANVAAVNGGVLLCNEVRVQEGYPPVAGGDVLRMVPGARAVTDTPAEPAEPADADLEPAQ